jgi:hypothetical protein
MKDLGKLRYFPNIEVIQSLKGLSLLQKNYALNKLSKYGMMGSKPISIPLEQNVKLSVDEGDFVDHYAQMHSGEFDLHDHHKAKYELCSWSGEFM